MDSEQQGFWSLAAIILGQFTLQPFHARADRIARRAQLADSIELKRMRRKLRRFEAKLRAMLRGEKTP